jgi:hypothetical protein
VAVAGIQDEEHALCRPADYADWLRATARRNELIRRLLAGQCEMCEGREGLQVHHVRKLADLSKPGRPERPPWVHLMAKDPRHGHLVGGLLHPVGEGG